MSETLEIGVLLVDNASNAQIGFIRFDPSGVLVYQIIKTGLHVFAFKPINKLLSEQWIIEPLYIKYEKLLSENPKLSNDILEQEANSCAYFLNSLDSPLVLGNYQVKAYMVVVPVEDQHPSKTSGNDTRMKEKHKSKSASTGSTSSNLKITLSACNPHTRKIFETLVNGWKEADGIVLCIRPGRIYLKLKTKAHTRGNSAQLPRNFNLVVLASPRGGQEGNIQITWGLGKTNSPIAYLDCIPQVVARFEKMTAALPGFVQKGTITRLIIDKQFKPLHAKLLMDGMKEVKDAEANAI